MMASAGGTLNDITKLTILLTDMKYYGEVSKIRYKYFKKDFPAATLFEVKSLAKKEWLLEIEAIAVLSN
jgi:enamine deaminase RidA (YjgF/YER057c/UK114 family)